MEIHRSFDLPRDNIQMSQGHLLLSDCNPDILHSRLFLIWGLVSIVCCNANTVGMYPPAESVTLRRTSVVFVSTNSIS
ncbi:hypothetical protein DAI22_01g233400 [Oryza sativa Japonica Group]|nr:hypothetical protein DAI22_01g233400 [Oryza sativa Japonica Group]